MDVGESDRLFWLTDLGWLMGPMLITAALLPRRHRGALRGRARLSEARSPVGAASSGTASRVLGISPTAVRALMPHGAERVHAPRSLVAPHPRLDRRAVEPGALPLALRDTRARRACRSSTTPAAPRSPAASSRCFPIAPIKPCSFAGPIPGMAADVLRRRRPAGARRRWASWSSPRPWPGMTAGFWKDPERYERDVLVALARRVGPRRLGATSTRTASGSSRAARTTR